MVDVVLKFPVCC